MRVPKPRKWVLWDLSDKWADVASPHGYRVGWFDTQKEAREFAVQNAIGIVWDPQFPNQAIDVAIQPGQEHPGFAP